MSFKEFRLSVMNNKSSNKMLKSFNICTLLMLLLLLSCNSGPKVIQPTDSEPRPEQGATPTSSELHEVEVVDFLDASRYTYLNVKEDDNIYWIAVPQMKVSKGDVFYYQDGVRMHNFESPEHGRVFETLLLVSAISKTPTHIGLVDRGEIDMHGGKSEPLTEKIEVPRGGTSLVELFDNPEKFSEKIVLIKGQCVKVNRNIMGKNWVHLQDGTSDGSGKILDLTVTTQEEIPLGAIVSLEGIIKLDRDFGAGYNYDVIMEDALIND